MPQQPAPSPARPHTLLKQVFGFDEFKPLQQEIIANVLARRDSLVIMPTGGGKSLCYQLPALIFEGLTVVVSPLISLMKDQVEQLQELGVPALFLNSSLSFEEYQENAARVRSRKIKLLYIAPESLLTPLLLDLVSSLKVDCLTIDEAHCISEWGHDFRPEYRQLVEVRARFPSAVCIALTATATARVRQDIKDSLGFQDSDEFIASFNRENLFLEIVPKSEPASQTLHFLQQFPDQSGIIYCFSRRQVDDLAAWLKQHGFSVLPYHAGLSDEERRRNQELFIRDEVQIIVATIAFGMGINKPNVRFVVHYDLPKNIESYYQEIGRSGRDGLPAHCLLLFSYSDVQKIKYFIDQKEEPERQVAQQHLNAMLRFAESDVCRRLPLLHYFGEDFHQENCSMCDNCTGSKQVQVDVTIPAQMFLSCVKRTGELFGANHIVDVLLGAETEKIARFNHQALSTYGIGKEYSKKQWLRLSNQLLQKGFLVQDGRYGSLKLTPKAYQFFNRKETLMGIIEEPELSHKRKGPSGKIGEPDYDAGLFDALRRLRKELADGAGLPPYVVFSDRSLVEMAAFFPQSPESFLEINGIGAAKLEKYGKIFMAVIAAYCEEHALTERPKREAARLSAAPPSSQKLRHIVIGEAYNAGRSIQEIKEEFQIQLDTVINHLSRFQQEGNALRRDGLLEPVSLPSDRQQLVLETFRRVGAQFLRPVYDALDGAVSFDDLKLLRLYYLALD